MDILSLNNWLANVGLLSLILLPLLYWFATYRFDYWKKKGINGPPALPFIGNLFSPFRPIPELQMDYIKKYGKFFGIYQGRRPALFIADPKVIKQILVKDFPIFRNRIGQPARHKVLSQHLVAARDEKWKRIRSILSPMFTTSKLKKMEPLISQCTDSMNNALEKLANGKESFLAHGVMGNFTMDVIAKCAFATETNAHSEENIFVQHARNVFNFSLFRVLLGISLPEFMVGLLSRMRVPGFHNKSTDFFLNTGYHLISQRRSNPRNHVDDMLQLMIKAEHGKDVSFEKEDEFDSHHVNVGKEELETEEKALSDIIGSKYLSEDEIVAQSMVFFLAGYETTASTLTYCLYELAANPDVQEKLFQEINTMLEQGGKLDYQNVMRMPYLDAVLSETLRKHPPALTLSREATEKYYIEEYNYTMEPGEGIIIPIYGMHHNSEYFKNPEKFDPERFMPENRDQIIPYTYLPFGGGPRNCIGMRFALAEAKLGLANIIYRYSVNRTEKTPKELKIHNSLFLLKTTPIYLGVKRRSK